MITIPVRASSWQELFDCPARWAAKNIDGIRTPTSGAAWLGTSLHKGTAEYDAARIKREPVGIDEAAAVMVAKLHSPIDEESGVEVYWEDSSAAKVEPIALTLLRRYCEEIAPQRDYIGVEVLCEELDIQCDGIAIRLTGTADRIRREESGYGISDIKSGQRAVCADGTAMTKGHGLQLGVYELLAENAIGKPITASAEVIGLQTTKQAKVGTGMVANTRTALIGTGDHPGAIEHAAAIMRSGMFYGNPKSMTCHEKYCPIFNTCTFN